MNTWNTEPEPKRVEREIRFCATCGEDQPHDVYVWANHTDVDCAECGTLSDLEVVA